MNFLSRYRDLLVVLLLILVPFLFYVSNNKEIRDHNMVDRVVVRISAPIQWIMISVIDELSYLWHRYFQLVHVSEENYRLQKENTALKHHLQAAEEYHLENIRLRQMVGLLDRAPQVKTIGAHVIATSPTPLFRSLRIDRGTNQNVQVGAAVITPEGLVGRVAAVSGEYADVILIVDANNSVDVVVQRSRAHARIRGLGSQQNLGVQVELLSRTDDIEPGDVLITSGAGLVFPAGISVGKVQTVERGQFGLYQKATVEPTVDFHRLEEVVVIPAGWPTGSTFEIPTGDMP